MKAVLFDLDGTLVDSIADIAGAMNEVLARLGLPVHATRDYFAFVGEGVVRLAERALPPGTKAAVRDEAADGYRAAYRARMLRETRPYDGVRAVLDALAAQRVALAVLSNKPDDATRAMVSALFADVPFAVVAGERAGVPRKPHADAALVVVRALGVAPGDAALVGDTRVDVETARAAGLRSVAVTWGFRTRAELEASSPDAIVDAPAALVPALSSLR